MVVDTKRLHGEIVANGYTVGKFAAKIGLSRAAFYRRMKAGVFNSDEMEKMIDALSISDPNPIFFAKVGTQDVTRANLAQLPNCTNRRKEDTV